MKHEVSGFLRIVTKIRLLCEEYALCVAEVGKRRRCVEIQKELEKFNVLLKGKIGINSPALLLALLDAYEITRDEAMLQEILDVVSKNLEQLEVSAEGVKLLAYCYYYVEEEECLIRAGKMLEELKRRGVDEEELAEVEKVLEELTGNF